MTEVTVVTILTVVIVEIVAVVLVMDFTEVMLTSPPELAHWGGGVSKSTTWKLP